MDRLKWGKVVVRILRAAGRGFVSDGGFTIHGELDFGLRWMGGG